MQNLKNQKINQEQNEQNFKNSFDGSKKIKVRQDGVLRDGTIDDLKKDNKRYIIQDNNTIFIDYDISKIRYYLKYYLDIKSKVPELFWLRINSFLIGFLFLFIIIISYKIRYLQPRINKSMNYMQGRLESSLQKIDDYVKKTSNPEIIPLNNNK